MDELLVLLQEREAFVDGSFEEVPLVPHQFVEEWDL